MMNNCGYLTVNGFLESTKFDALYDTLSKRAKRHGLTLVRKANTELMMETTSLSPIGGELLPYAVFWDKDIRLAYELERAGMRLFNSARAIELCDDKSLTHIALAGKVAMPRTVIIPLTFPRIGYTQTVFLEKIADTLGIPFIIKECFGSFGAQVYKANNIEEARELLKKTAGSAAIAQEYIESSFGRDVRVYVVGDECVAAMLRESTSGDFRANVALGSRATRYELNDDERRVALKVARELGLDFAGVDLLFGRGGEPLLCEVNSNAHFAGISEATGVDVADRIMAHVARTLHCE